jgi:hypothetical protein
VGLTYLGIRDKIRQTLGRFNIVSWERGVYAGLIWRFDGDPSKIDGFEIKHGEVVVYAPPAGGSNLVRDVGVWKIDTKHKVPGLSVTWIDIGAECRLLWGASDVLTKDLARIGAHGFVDVRIENPVIFLERLVAGRSQYTVQDLDAWVKAEMSAVMKDVLQNYDLLQLDRERQAFQISAREKCQDAFGAWGLGFSIFEVSGFGKPPSTSEVLAELGRRTEQAKAEVEARKQIELTQIEAETARQRSLVGLAEERSKVDVARAIGASQASQIGQRARREEIETEKIRGLADAAVLAQKSVAAVAGDIELKKVEQIGENARQNALLLMTLLLNDQQIRAVKEMADVMEKMAEAVAKGGLEGDKARKEAEAEFAQLLQKAGVDLSKLEKAKALGILPKNVLFIDKD